jgi:hypothetical protein
MYDFIIDAPTALFKSDHWSERLLKYSVNIMGDHVEKKGAVASEISKLTMHFFKGLW